MVLGRVSKVKVEAQFSHEQEGLEMINLLIFKQIQELPLCIPRRLSASVRRTLKPKIRQEHNSLRQTFN